jgi:low temperature requirement protein LtrA
MEIISKRVSWLELFYDLAYVALIAQFTYLVASHHESWIDLFNIVIVGYTIFIAWWGTTVNRNLQDTETVTDKLLVQVQMVGAFVMSLTMPAVFAGHYEGYFITLAVLRFFQLFMLLRMYRLHPHRAPKTYNIVQGIAVAGGLWFISALIADPYHIVLAFAALALDVLAPLTVGKGNSVNLLNIPHLQERLGLFLLFVMGESMIVVALANTATSLTLWEPVFVLAGFGTMLALWWIYFYYFEQYAGTRPKNLFIYLHAHGFLFGSIVVLSVGYKLLLGGKAMAAALPFMLIGYLGIALTLLVVWYMYVLRRA